MGNKNKKAPNRQVKGFNKEEKILDENSLAQIEKLTSIRVSNSAYTPSSDVVNMMYGIFENLLTIQKFKTASDAFDQNKKMIDEKRVNK